MYQLGSLSQCMTDADPESISHARRLRSKSLLTSVGFEVALLALLVLWPLFSPGVLGRHIEVVPLPPLRFTPLQDASQAAASSREALAVTDYSPRFSYRPPGADHPAVSSREGPTILGDPWLVVETGFPSGAPSSLGTDISVAPPPAVANKPPRISLGTLDGSLIRRVDPEYPVLAKSIRLSGVVRLHAVVGTDGTVRELQVLSGSPILTAAAETAVRQWRYKPTLLNGEPVEVETYVTVNFVLQ